MQKQDLPSELDGKWKGGWGIRYTQAIYLFLVLTAAYALRFNLSLAIVSMTTSLTDKIVLTSGEKAWVLSSFFWGYSLLQTFLGDFGRKTNAAKLFSLCLMISSIVSLGTPIAALHFGAYGIIFVRVLMGIIQGGIYPNLNNLLSAWVIPQEKDAVFFFVYLGSAFGNFLAMVTSGYIATQYGWPFTFYSTGLVGIIIGALYFYLGKCDPEDHEGISKEEKEFMKNSSGGARDKNAKSLPVPWKEILTSAPFLALTFTHWCGSWGIWTISTLTPTYMNGALDFDVESDGFLTALSASASMVLALIFSIISIYTRKRNSIPVRLARFIWNTIGMYGSGIALIVLSFTKDTSPAIALITIANGITVAVNTGYMANHGDLAPNFAGVLYAFTNSIANTASILGPLISTYMVTDTSDTREWKFVFLLSAAVLFLGNTIFLYWGTTKKQDWNNFEKAAQLE